MQQHAAVSLKKKHELFLQLAWIQTGLPHNSKCVYMWDLHYLYFDFLHTHLFLFLSEHDISGLDYRLGKKMDPLEYQTELERLRPHMDTLMTLLSQTRSKTRAMKEGDPRLPTYKWEPLQPAHNKGHSLGWIFYFIQPRKIEHLLVTINVVLTLLWIYDQSVCLDICEAFFFFFLLNFKNINLVNYWEIQPL